MHIAPLEILDLELENRGIYIIGWGPPEWTRRNFEAGLASVFSGQVTSISIHIYIFTYTQIYIFKFKYFEEF